MIVEKLFDELDGELEAKVRDYKIETTRFQSYGELSILSEGVAYIDAEFNLKIFDRLHKPAIIGVERIVDGELWYTIFEVTSVKAFHLEMGSLQPDIPPLIKWDTLDRIRESWYKGGENWMSIIAVNTGYRIRMNDEKEVEVIKDNLSPLVGSKAHLMSADLYGLLINKPVDTSINIGKIVGYDLDTKIDINAIFRYHTGIFGYTGTGKSNLVSVLMRESLEKIGDLAIVVIDISGEYPVNILDLLEKYGVMYLDPSIPMKRFVDTTVFPETFEDLLNEKGVDKDVVLNILRNVEKRYFESDPEYLTVYLAIETLNSVVGRIPPYLRPALEKAKKILSKYDMDQYTYEIMSISQSDWNEIQGALDHVIKNAGRGSAKDILNGLSSSMSVKPEDGDRSPSIYEIAHDILFGGSKRVYLFYIPEAIKARMVIYKLIKTLFRFKKMMSGGRKVLIVVDEAHEFMPRETKKENQTVYSSEALELLFRQGRKYGIGGWIATQRVAHLNTNILQQLHSYFISVLPRSYDRTVIADTFSISKSVVDNVVNFEKGEWLFMSHVATRYPGIPVRIKAHNNEDILIKWLISKGGNINS